MPHDPRVDDYIARKSGFAKSILKELRRRVHAACPEAEETLKWGAPAFMYKGSILANMAAFKAHAVFGFWQGEAVTGDSGKGAMGSFGRLTSVADLPSEKEFAALVEKAKALIDSGGKRPRPIKHPKADIPVPEDLRQALDQSPAAAATFEAFSPSCRREYLEWVVDAKRPETRAKRVAQAAEWMAQGKKRNWKYESC